VWQSQFVGVGDTALAEAFTRLSDADREVLALIAWEGLDARSAAQVLGCSAPTATMRVFRARRRLRAFLDEEEGAR
jgi:DNA-directed RNA polymerase specialized sigma24 family protein